MVITGQKAVRKSKQGKFQIVDIVAMMKPVTKFSASITNGNDIAKIFSEAVSLAEAERPGAVHIELPEDIGEVCDATSIFPKKLFLKLLVKIHIEAVKKLKSKHR